MTVDDYLQSHDVGGGAAEAAESGRDCSGVPAADFLSRLNVARSHARISAGFYQRQVRRRFRYRHRDHDAHGAGVPTRGRLCDRQSRCCCWASARQRDEHARRSTTRCDVEAAARRGRARTARDRDQGHAVSGRPGATSTRRTPRRRRSASSLAFRAISPPRALAAAGDQSADRRRQPAGGRAAPADSHRSKLSWPAQNGRLTGGNTAIAAGLGSYERLQMQQDFPASSAMRRRARSYETGAAERGRSSSTSSGWSNPNMPVKVDLSAALRHGADDLLSCCWSSMRSAG